ncbi:4-coumarate--CoA ligase-like 9 [Humulus lupulus]|uniref:4-coumarate--CoA ligase-like 9 n=1 Tax=Humulus lupulus TaxID=3486 RepID=UPI002B415C36|nr:4-coumarate--CoA ligase-like 9 [Humulus lupulus]
MAKETNHSRWIDPKSGFCPDTKIFHSLRPPVPLPPLSKPLSLTEYALSLLQSYASKETQATTTALIDLSSGVHVSYSHLLRQIRSLALSLKSQFPFLSKDGGHRTTTTPTAFVLCPTSLHVPVVYFALMSLGVVVSPANPVGSDSDVTHQVQLTRPAIAFATSSTARKLPPSLPTILLDSPEFLSMLDRPDTGDLFEPVHQTDTAAILYSSGTTGRVKGVALTHRNLIAILTGYHELRLEPADPSVPEPHPVSLFFLPLFHVFGFFMLARAVALGETLVLMERFDFEPMLRAVEKYKVTYMPVSPPLVVALVNSELARKYDLSSLRLLGCGGAPLGEETIKSFNAKYPNVEITQGYGLTESAGSVTRMLGEEETKRYASVGRLAENMEAKIVDPDTSQPLPPGKRGELWLRGPLIMKGYVGDEKATAETLDSEGWLKTGDLCMFDSEGCLYIVDRLKELIKYKAYQVPPAELEHLLHSHPDIVDAAVIPYPDEVAGQLPMAYVVRKPGSNLTEAQVMDFVAQKVAPYKKVRRVAFISAIPKSPAGKILRRELVNHALSKGSSKL